MFKICLHHLTNMLKFVVIVCFCSKAHNVECGLLKLKRI